MKRALSLLLALFLLLSASACGQQADARESSAPAADPVPQTESAAAAASEPTGTASGEAAAAAGDFTYEPYWTDEDAVRTAVGGEILFFGDIHDYEDDYFYYDAATGETRGVFTYLVNNDKHPGLYACIGDYLQSSHDITDPTGVYFKCLERITAYAGEDIPVDSVMGNHENDTAAADGLTGEQVFEKTVGNNNYGLAIRGVSEENPEETIYYVVNFGAAHVDETDAVDSRANATNKYWVNPDQIAALDETLASIYGEDGSQNIGVPTFINAHIPIHYYTSERSALNNEQLLSVLNKYPYVVYVWGHNHSEKDPYYGTVKLPGNTIVPCASLDTELAGGETAAQEINFTYISCGVVRGNQISDNSSEDSERALYVTVDGSTLSFEYCGRDGEIFDRTAYTSMLDQTYFEDFTTLGAASAAGATVDITAADASEVQRADFFLARPVAGQMPGTVTEFSDRYETSVEWLDKSGSAVTNAFEYGMSYTARLTLTGDVAFTLTDEDVYLFDASLAAIPSRYIESVTVTAGEGQAVIDILFRSTAAMADTPVAAAAEIEAGAQYALCSASEQYCFTLRRADCVVENGELLTVPDETGAWSFESAEGGFYLKNANGQYLTAGVNGPHTVLTPMSDLAGAASAVWTFTDGALHISVSGKDYCLTETGGSFALTTGASGAVQLFRLD